MSAPHYPHPIIAREGWPFIIMAALASLLSTWWWAWWSIPFWLITLFIVQFFRDPPRLIPDEPGAVLAPADGRVTLVERMQNPYTQADALRISIFMNVFNVHSNRSPVDGVVRKVTYHPGQFLNAALDKASLENERNALEVETPEGVRITFVQIAGLIARRILCYAKEGDTLKRGQRYGMIRFGSRVDVYLPPDVQVRVVVGDRVAASTSVIAHLA